MSTRAALRRQRRYSTPRSRKGTDGQTGSCTSLQGTTCSFRRSRRGGLEVLAWPCVALVWTLRLHLFRSCCFICRCAHALSEICTVSHRLSCMSLCHLFAQALRIDGTSLLRLRPTLQDRQQQHSNSSQHGKAAGSAHISAITLTDEESGHPATSRSPLSTSVHQPLRRPTATSSAASRAGSSTRSEPTTSSRSRRSRASGRSMSCRRSSAMASECDGVRSGRGGGAGKERARRRAWLQQRQPSSRCRH